MSLASRIFRRAMSLAFRPVSGARQGSTVECHGLGDARRATESLGRSAAARQAARWALGGVLAWAAAWWLLAPASGPTRRTIDALLDNLGLRMGHHRFPADVSTPQPQRRRMHVAEVVPTDATFREPARAFSGTAYWRVAIQDAHGQPVAAALVQVEIVGPDTAVRERPLATTGGDGLARFTYSLRRSDLPGVYTVRVVAVSHADCSEAAYDSAANDARSTSFSVNAVAVVPHRAGVKEKAPARATPPRPRNP
jgi:hypothetical protein